MTFTDTLKSARHYLHESRCIPHGAKIKCSRVNVRHHSNDSCRTYNCRYRIGTTISSRCCCAFYAARETSSFNGDVLSQQFFVCVVCSIGIYKFSQFPKFSWRAVAVCPCIMWVVALYSVAIGTHLLQITVSHT